MAQYFWPQTVLRLCAIAAIFVATLCTSPHASWAQWDLKAMLAAKTDWFAHQCFIADQPRLKAVTFMAVGDFKLFRFIIQDNEMMSASYDLSHKAGKWEVDGEPVFGGGYEVKKEIYRLDFRLLTSEQFNTLIGTQPKEACKG